MSIPENRVVAGLRCTDVLERLEAYVGGHLTPQDRAAVERHLDGCDVCTRFGGAYAAVVRTIRSGLDGGLDEDRAGRLDRALRQLPGGGS